MKKGRLYLLVSAVIYGFIPVLTKRVSISGGSGTTTVFLRSVLSLPLLLIILKSKKINMRLTKREAAKIAVLGLGGFAPAMVFLYAAYASGEVGVATMLHFTYPFVIVLVCAAVFKEKMPLLKWVGILFAAIGVLLSLDMNTNARSAVLALMSGLFYAFFVIYMDKSGIDKMDDYKLTFYLSVIMAAASAGAAAADIGLKFPTDFGGWLAAFMISVLTTLAAIPLFQAGVKLEGAAEAGIVSMAEPVCGVIFGVSFLSEPVTLAGIIGCVLLGIGVFCVEIS